MLQEIRNWMQSENWRVASDLWEFCLEELRAMALSQYDRKVSRHFRKPEFLGFLPGKPFEQVLDLLEFKTDESWIYFNLEMKKRIKRGN